MEKEIKKVEKTYSVNEVMSITSLNQGEKFHLGKKFKDKSLTREGWEQLFKQIKLTHVKFLI